MGPGRFVWVALAAGGCELWSHFEPDDADDTATEALTDCLVPPLTLACGTGAFEFEPLADGDPVTMAHGPAGGWYLWIGGRAEFTTPLVALTSSITVPALGGLAISGSEPPAQLALDYDDEACAGTFWGQRSLIETTAIDPTPNHQQEVICGLDGATLRLRLDVTELYGAERRAACEVDVVAEIDPIDDKACAELTN